MPIVKNSEDLDYDYLENLYEKKIFEEYKPQTIASRRYEEIKVSTDKSTFKLIDKNQRDTVSLIHGEIRYYHGVEYFEISWTYSKYPRQGNLTYLFDLLLFEFEYKIISDKYHTSPGSKEFWQSLMRKKKYKIFRYNLESNHKRSALKYNEKDIWGIDEKGAFIEQPNYLEYDNLDDNNESEYINEYIESMEKEIENTLLNIDNDEHTAKNKKDTVSKERIRLIAQK